MATGNSATVTTIYQSIAGGLSPSAADLATYTALMNGGWTAAQVAAAIEVSPLVTNVVNPVIREYQAAFGRVPDQAGLNFWVGVESKVDPTNAPLTALQLNSLATTFVGAAEFTSRYGATWTPTTVITSANGAALVTALYSNILGRGPDAAGLNYWLTANVTVANLLSSFAQSAEFINVAAPGITVFETLESVGQAPTSGSLLNLGSATGNLIPLTTGIDTLTGTAGSDTFVGSMDGSAGVYTVNPGDSLNGVSGNDTFKVVLANYNNTLDLRGVTVSNVANFLLNDATSSFVDDSLYLNNNAYSNVTIDNTYWAYVYNINEGTRATVTLNDGATDAYGAVLYFNNSNAVTVTMNDVVTGAANVTSDVEGEFYHGYNGGSDNGLTAAQTINANLTLQNVQIANYDGSGSAYQYIYAENLANSGAAINTTLTVQNNSSDGTTYSDASQDIYQTGNAKVTSVINISNSHDVWVEVDANENGSVTAAAANNSVTINASNFTTMGSGDNGIGVYGFDTVTMNVTGPVTLDDDFQAQEYHSSSSSTNSQTVTINASAAFKTNDTDLDSYGTTKLVVTGSGSVDMGTYYASGSSTLSTATGAVVSATIDASANSGGFKVDVEGAINSVKGGTGNDVILVENITSFGSAALGGLALDGGAGSNTVGFTGAGYATVTAGAGADIAKIVNFQTLEITNAGGVPNGIYDLSLLAGSSLKNFTAKDGVAAGSATVTHLVDGSTVTLMGNLHTDTGTLVATLNTLSATPTLNVVVNGDFAENLDATADVTTNAANLSVANVTTLNVNSTGNQVITPGSVAEAGDKTDTATNTLTLTNDTALVTLNVTGNQKLVWAASGAENLLATVDASASSGGSSLDVHLIATTQALTIKGGSGSDTITVGGGNDTITTGAGKDTVVIAAASASSAIFPVITDLATNDKLQFTLENIVNANGAFGAALTSNVNDYQTFLNAGSHNPAGTASWFQFGGDTYIMVETNGNNNYDAGVDTVVKLTGLHDLSLSTWSGSGGHATLTIV